MFIVADYAALKNPFSQKRLKKILIAHKFLKKKILTKKSNTHRLLRHCSKNMIYQKIIYSFESARKTRAS